MDNSAETKAHVIAVGNVFASLLSRMCFLENRIGMQNNCAYIALAIM